MIGAALRNWLAQELRWPMGQQEVALSSMPLLFMALPLAARDVVLPTAALLWAYSGAAIVGAGIWGVLCMNAITQARNTFYLKHERPLLSKEYQDG